MVDVSALSTALAAVAPCIGVSIGDPADRSTWRVDYDPAPSDAQRQATADAIANWTDPVPVATVTGRQIVGQVKAAGAGSAVLTFLASSSTISAMPTSIAYWTAVALDTRVPIDNAKMANILKGAGVADVSVFMAAALLLPA